MANNNTEYFDNLYNFIGAEGVRLPQTSTVIEQVQNAFKIIFAKPDLDVTSQTIIGRLIEAIALFNVNVLGINAQNANGINPNVAIGDYLDSIASLFGLSRLEGESDDSFRKRILQSQSRGIGYVESIRNALSSVSGVKSVCVLDNGSGYPRNIDGIVLAPHSIYVCLGLTDPQSESNFNDIASAIRATKSLGCSFTNAYPNVKTVTFTEGGITTGHVDFYVSEKIGVNISITARNASSLSNDEARTKVREIIKSIVNGAFIPSTITTDDITANIAIKSGGVISTNTTITIDGETSASIHIAPNKHVEMTDDDITVTFI